MEFYVYKYKINIETSNSYIYSFPPNTTLQTAKSYFEMSENLIFDLKDKNGNNFSANFIGTGCKIEILHKGDVFKSYILAIKGDINSDGLKSIDDLVSLKKALLKITSLENEYKIAADLNNDSQMSISDLLMLKKDILFG